jgi:hypothetical protein
MLDHEVAQACERKLGLGEFPLVRRRLFSRLQRVCQTQGDVALRIVAEALQGAENLRDRVNGGPATQASKGKWFCVAVVRRLTDAGYWGTDSPNQTRAQATAARETVATARGNVVAASVPPRDSTPTGPAYNTRAEMEAELDRRDKARRAEVEARLRESARLQDLENAKRFSAEGGAP